MPLVSLRTHIQHFTPWQRAGPGQMGSPGSTATTCERTASSSRLDDQPDEMQFWCLAADRVHAVLQAHPFDEGRAAAQTYTRGSSWRCRKFAHNFTTGRRRASAAEDVAMKSAHIKTTLPGPKAAALL